MKTLAVQDVAIAEAMRNETLSIVERFSDRFGEPYWLISDNHGVIEICLSQEEVDRRVTFVKERVGE